MDKFHTQIEQTYRLLNESPKGDMWKEHAPGWADLIKKRIPEWICGQYPAFALRVTNHPIAAALAKAVGHPIVSTSCNPSNQMPAKTIHQVRKYFPTELDSIAAGNLGGNKNPSEIRDLLTGNVIRPS